RANFWPNTPDILPFHLQNAPKSAFEVRCFLAATLSSNWGMYSGYEHIENQPLPGREEYLDSEKFQLKERDWEKPGNIKGFIGQVNRCRKEHPALQEYANIEFVHCDNEQVIGYYKRSDDGSDLILCFANLDFNSRQESSVHLNLEAMGLDPSKPFTVKDLIYNEVYEWRDSSNFVSLDPTEKTVHLFHVTQ
ncbi:MAG: alpha-1,4-glucan--maltose-1-phosphate maltosyltransferase, partial [Verrucomicrobiota bacterium]